MGVHPAQEVLTVRSVFDPDCTPPVHAVAQTHIAPIRTSLLDLDLIPDEGPFAELPLSVGFHLLGILRRYHELCYGAFASTDIDTDDRPDILCGDLTAPSGNTLGTCNDLHKPTPHKVADGDQDRATHERCGYPSDPFSVVDGYQYDHEANRYTACRDQIFPWSEHLWDHCLAFLIHPDQLLPCVP